MREKFSWSAGLRIWASPKEMLNCIIYLRLHALCVNSALFEFTNPNYTINYGFSAAWIQPGAAARPSFEAFRGLPDLRRSRTPWCVLQLRVFLPTSCEAGGCSPQSFEELDVLSQCASMRLSEFRSYLRQTGVWRDWYLKVVPIVRWCDTMDYGFSAYVFR